MKKLLKILNICYTTLLMHYYITLLKRAKKGFEPLASAHEADILPLNYFAL